MPAASILDTSSSDGNDAPVFSDLDASPSYTEGAAAVTLDASVAVFDADLATLNGGAGNYAGASITWNRHGGPSADDVFVAGGNLVFNNNQAILSGTQVGSVFNTGGRLHVTFNANATQAAVNEVLSSIRYANLSDTPPASVQIDWSFSDGNGTALGIFQGTGGALPALGSTTVSITPIDDAPTFAAAAPGTGKVVTDIGNLTDDGVRSVAVQADGKIVVAGYSNSGGSSNFAVVRYNADGSLDTSFNGTGKLVTDIGSSTEDGGYGVTVQADGKIVVAGYSNSGGSDNFAVVRYNTDGSLDTSFNGTGKLVTDIGASTDDRGYGVTVQADGKILVAGTTGTGGGTDFALVRYNANGSLDTSFNGTGKQVTDIGSSTSDAGFSLALQADGKIVVAGRSSGSSSDFAVVRYNADGSLDTSFNGTGKAVTDIGSRTFDGGNHVTVQPDGKIVVVGSSDSGGSPNFAIARYNADGSLDTSFNGSGTLVNDIGPDDRGTNVTVQSDGKIVVVGSSNRGGSNDFAVARYNADGRPDRNFIDRVVTDIGASTDDFGFAVNVQADGKIVVAGTSNSGGSSNFAVVRYNADGSLDTSFGANAVGSLGGSVAYTENAAPIALDASVAVFDAELAALKASDGGAGNYGGARVILSRTGGSNAEDVFTGLGNLSLIGGFAFLSGNVIGSVVSAAGTLTITFSDYVTQARVNAALSSIGYANTSDAPPASVQVAWTFSDGNSGSQGSGGTLVASGTSTVAISALNDAPIISGVPAAAQSVAAGTAAALADFTVADADGAGVTLAVTLTAVNGVINGLADADAGAPGIQLAGTAADINAAIAAATFTATAEGPASVGIRVSDAVAPAVTGSYTLTAVPRNVAPVFTNLDATPSYTEGGAAVVLDASVAVVDANLAALNGGSGNYNGASITLGRHGGPSGDDAFSAGGNLVFNNNHAILSGTQIGSVFNTGGTLLVTFNANATQAAVDEALSSIRYANTSNGPPASVQIDWSFSDGNDSVLGSSSSQGSGGALTALGHTTVGITAVNAAPTFAPVAPGSGKLVTDFGGFSHDRGLGVTVQTDGKIVVAGDHFSLRFEFAVLRYNANGSLDTSFTGSGMRLADIGVSASAQSVTVQPDGKVILAGQSQADGGSPRYLALARFNADGGLDSSFSSSGKLATEIGSDVAGRSVIVQADGKIVVAGTASGNFAVVRYNADGSLDSGFNGTGKLLTDIFGSDIGNGMTLQADGKIVVAGSSSSTSAYPENFAVVRYNADGSLDTSFNGTGKLLTDIGSATHDSGNSVAVQADGKIVVAGTSDDDFAVVRYNADGSLDTSFHGTGKVVTDIGSSSGDAGNSVSVQADGKIVVAGTSGSDFAVVRYNGDGSLDSSFNGTGKLVTDINTKDVGNSVTVQADGKIVVAGYSIAGNLPSDIAVVRYNADGSLDTSFGASAGVGTLGGTVAYVENAAAIALDSSVVVFDAELAALDAGAGNYGGASVTLRRSNGSNAEDVFAGLGNLGLAGGNAVLSGTTVGTVTQAAGTLTITFNANATQARVNETLSSIGYANKSDAPVPSVQIAWSFSDGNTGGQGTGGALTALGSTTVVITPVNDLPTGSVTITGTPTQGHTLAASNSLADADGLGTISYQWLADGAPVGAPSPTLVLAQAQVGKAITVRASYTDAYGTIESQVSAATAAVADSNDAPVISNLDAAPSYTEGTAAVTLDASVAVFDVELGARDGGAGNYGGASLTLSRHGGPSGDDVYTAGGNLAFHQNAVTLSGTQIGSVLNTGGVLVVTFNANATQAAVNEALSSICYANASNTPPASVQIDWSFSDGNGGGIGISQGVGGELTALGSTTVTLVATNDAPTFVPPGQGTGKQVTDIGNATDDQGQGVTIQADGKIVVAGTSNGLFAVARYNADGSLDTRFNGSGKLVTGIGGLSSDTGQSVTVQADGKIVVAGTSFGGGSNNFAVARYNADGSLDTGFNGTGKLVTDIGNASDDVGRSVAVQADGKIVVAGWSANGGSPDFAVVRYNANGSLDTSFNGTGKVVTDSGSSGSDLGFSLVVQADGKILVAGRSDGSRSSDIALLRYNADGSADTSFNGSGRVVTDIGKVIRVGSGDTDFIRIPTFDQGYSVSLQADGKIVVSGLTSRDSYDIAVARYNVDGSLDTSFGQGTGIVVTDIGASTFESGYSVTVQADGKIVVAGYSDSGGSLNFAVVRYGADGSLDTSFNGTGKLVTDIGSSTREIGLGVTVQADGRIVVAGYSDRGGSNDFAVVRYNADGSLDSSFGEGAAAGTLGGTVAYVENAAAIALDPSVAVFDSELAALDGGKGNYGGASVTLQRSGGSEAQDVFSALGGLHFSGGNAVLKGTTIGTVTQGAGTLTINFNAGATQARVNETLSSIAYANTSDAPPASVQIAWSFSDGNAGGQGNGDALTALGHTTVEITPVNDLPTGSVTITGIARQGEVLTASNDLADADGLGFVSYQWLADDVAVGAPSPTLVLGQAQFGKAITVRASYTDAFGTPESKVSTATAPVAVPNTLPAGTVVITGTATQGQTLTASNSLTDADGPAHLVVNYQWQAAGEDIAGATGATIVLAQAQVGKAISVKASYTDAVGTPESKVSAATTPVVNVNDAPTGTVTISGTPTQGQILTASNTLADVDGLGTISYQWLADNVAIGAPSTTLFLGPAQVGKTITVRASYVDGFNASESVTSAATSPVAADVPGGTTTITGTASADSLVGTDGADQLFGLEGNDTLLGNGGADRLIGGAGDDSLVGGAGNDLFVWVQASSVAEGRDRVADFGAGDALQVNGFFFFSGLAADAAQLRQGQFSLSTYNPATNTTTLAVGTDTVTGADLFIDLAGAFVAANFDVTVDGASFASRFAFRDLVVPTAGDDSVPGSAFADTIDGLAGKDTIDGGSGLDLLLGNDGDDLLLGGSESDTLVGGAGNDTLDGGAALGSSDVALYDFSARLTAVTFVVAGNPAAGTISQSDGLGGMDVLTDIETISVVGGSAADVLAGGAGVDWLEGGAGNDTLTGGSGADVFWFEPDKGTNGRDLVTDFGVGDSLVFRGLLGSFNVVDGLALLRGQLSLTYDSAGNKSTVSVGVDSVAGADMFIDLGGNLGGLVPSVSGFFSAGVSVGFALSLLNPATLTPGTGSDRLGGTAGNDSVDGLAGNDTIRGGDGNDTLVGGAGLDSLVGENGNDRLDAGDGDDQLMGGFGADTLIGGDGFDLVSYAYLPDAGGYNIDGGLSSVVVSGHGANAGYSETDSISSVDGFFGSIASDRMRDLAIGRETYLIGSYGNDTLIGSPYDGNYDYATYFDRNNAQFVELNLATGTATVRATADSSVIETDTLISLRGGFGTSGNDVFTGSAKDEYFRGGAGNDTADGGAGTDVASYNTSTAALTIMLLDNGAQVTFADGLGGTDTLRNIEGIHGGSAADVLTGNNLDNVLRGNGGNDTLDGGAGSDFAEYRNNAVNIALAAVGVDTIARDGVVVNGVEGTDTLRNIENLSGSNNADTLSGNEVSNRLYGRAGNDVLSGGFGNDKLDGGADFDTARYDYLTDANGYVFLRSMARGAELAATVMVIGRGSNAAYTEQDDVKWVERIAGTAGNDSMTDVRAGYDTWFQGGTGNDTLAGNAQDTDYADYSERDATHTISANLASGTVTVAKNGSPIETDTLVDIHGIVGTQGADSLLGSGGDVVEVFRGNGGNDTIDGAGGALDVADYRDATVAVAITLAESGDTTAVDGQGGTDTLRNVEGLAGSSFNDTLTGNSGNNVLLGRGGNDLLTGGAGMDIVSMQYAGTNVSVVLDDTGNASGVSDGEGGTDTLVGIEGLIGGVWADTLTGSSQVNYLDGGDGDDLISGKGGNDTLLGREGFDTFDYAYLPGTGANGYTITVQASRVVVAGRGTNAGYGEVDQVDQVDQLNASAGDDLLTDATVGRETTFRPGLGNDTIVGQLTENDVVTYSERAATTPVVIDLRVGTATIGSEVDTLVGIRSVIGGAGADTLQGSDLDEIFRGRGGNDSIDGGAGTDIASYTNGGWGIVVHMAAPGSTFTVEDGEGGIDTLAGIEGIFGTNHDDELVGNAADNQFRGRNGWDTIDGGGGRDSADYSNADHGIAITLAPVGQETLVEDDGEGGQDFLRNIEDLFGSGFDDTLTGNAADNTLRGRGGNDLLDGAGGFDIADYSGSGPDNRVSSGVTATLAESGAGFAQDGLGGTDTLLGIEGIIGSNDDDQLAGNGQANLLQGALGNDALSGGGGDDTLLGGAGDDTLAGGTGSDVLTGGAGADVFSYDLAQFDADSIADFAAGDVIRVAALLAAGGVTAGSNPSGHGVQADVQQGVTVLSFDTDGNAGAELRIRLDGDFAIERFSVGNVNGAGEVTYWPPGTGVKVEGLAYAWKSHLLLDNVGVGAAQSAATAVTGNDGQFHLAALVPGERLLSASRAATDTGSAINSADALAALRIAVGLNPNPDPDGAGPRSAPKLSPYQLIAADVDKDGKVNSADALAILRMAVKTASAPANEWLFVNEKLDLWDEKAAGGGASLLGRNSAAWANSATALSQDTTANFVAVLKGDVDGSWAPAGGAQNLDLDTTTPNYFQLLGAQLGVPTDLWGV